jgi:hypothetical protein
MIGVVSQFSKFTEGPNGRYTQAAGITDEHAAGETG